MVRILKIAVIVTMMIFPSQASATLLGTAGEFNTFIFGDYSGSSDAEGRVAVGGNAYLDHFSVADKLTPEEVARYQEMLIVGGDLTFTGGRVYYGNIVVGGSADGVDPSVLWGLQNDGAKLLTTNSLPVDFEKEEIYLKATAEAMSKMEANGTIRNEWGGLILKGDGVSENQIFNIDADTLLGAWGIDIQDIPPNATVIINVSGKNAGLTNMNLEKLAPIRNKVLFNFYEATILQFSSVGVQGSVLAPYAYVENPQGVINGTIIAQSWSGPMQQNHQLFNGSLDFIGTPDDTPTSPTPEPGTLFLLGFGLVPLLGFARKKKRA